MPLPYDTSMTALFSPQEQNLRLPAAASPPGELAVAAQCARLAYVRAESGPGESARLEAALADMGFGDTAIFRDLRTSTFAFGCVRREDGLALVSIRGTQPDELRDVLSDANVFPADDPHIAGARVHSGFRACASSIEPAVRSWLLQLDPQPARVLVCGHSLGAAIATLLAVPLGVHHLVTFGSPRVGDAAFVSGLTARAGLVISRVINGVDVVTMVPPAAGDALDHFLAATPPPVQLLLRLSIVGDLLKGLTRLALHYQHVGTTVYIDFAGNVHHGAVSTVISVDRVRPAFWMPTFGLNVVPLRLLSDHAPINYIRALWP